MEATEGDGALHLCGLVVGQGAAAVGSVHLYGGDERRQLTLTRVSTAMRRAERRRLRAGNTMSGVRSGTVVTVFGVGAARPVDLDSGAPAISLHAAPCCGCRVRRARQCRAPLTRRGAFPIATRRLVERRR